MGEDEWGTECMKRGRKAIHLPQGGSEKFSLLLTSMSASGYSLQHFFASPLERSHFSSA